MPFKVAVVGAGISGLCTALALHQAGHTVHVFEKSRFAGEVGSAVLITPNAERVLSRLGVDFKKARADSVEYFKVFDAITLQPLSDVALLDPKEEFGAPLYTVHRVDLLNELLRLASGVNVQLGVKVVGADAEKGTIILEDETEFSADLVVAADGVHSILRSEVLRDHHFVQASHSGMSTFRFMIHTSEMEHSSHFQELQKMRGSGCCLFADTKKSTEHHMVWFTCRDKQVQVFVGVHDTVAASPEDLQDVMMAEFGHYHPSLVELFRAAPLVTDWRLDSHEPLPVWHRKSIVLVGDAAHPMLPLGAQGANQAIEDAGALGALFCNGEPVSKIPLRLHTYERVRRLRAARVQKLSQTRLGREADAEAELRKYIDPSGASIPRTLSERYKHDYGFNVFDACQEALIEEKVLLAEI